jgi:hypothetical protein
MPLAYGPDGNQLVLGILRTNPGTGCTRKVVYTADGQAQECTHWTIDVS